MIQQNASTMHNLIRLQFAKRKDKRSRAPSRYFTSKFWCLSTPANGHCKGRDRVRSHVPVRIEREADLGDPWLFR